MGDVEQSVVVRREELYRLDFSKLEEVLSQINRIKIEKKELDSSARK